MHQDGGPVPSTSSAKETKRPESQTSSSSTQSLPRQDEEANRVRGNENPKTKRARVTQEACGLCGASKGQCHAPIEGYGECPYGVEEGTCNNCGGVLGFVEGSETICTENRCKDPYNAERTRPILMSSTEVAHYDWITAITDMDGQLRSEYAKSGGRIAILTGVDGRRDGTPVECREFYKTDICQMGKKFKLEELERKKDIKIQCFDVGKLACKIRSIKSKLAPDFNDCQELKDIEDELRKFDPTVAIHAYCWSDHSILNWVLQSRGINAELNVRWDLAIITNGRYITMDQIQKDVLVEVVNERPGVVFLWGSSGTGKTLVAVQATLTLAAHYEIENQPWQLFICVPSGEMQLNEEMKDNYFSSVGGRDNVTFISLNDLAVKYGHNFENVLKMTPSDFIRTLNTLTNCIHTKNPDIKNILFMDEVTCTEDENGVMDFSNLEASKNINMVMAMSPGSGNLMGHEYQVKASKNQSILSRQLISPYRYASWMLIFLQYWQYHRIFEDKPASRLSNENDIDPEMSHLPRGFIPTWIDGGWGENEASYTDMLKKVKEILDIHEGVGRTLKEEKAKKVEEEDESWRFLISEESVRSVTVLYELEDSYCEEVESFCNSQNWRYRNVHSFTGCEDQAS